MTITIIHNPRCGKSRQALEILNQSGKTPNIRLYLKEPLTRKELKEILKKLDIKPLDLIRKNEKIYKENFKGEEMTDAQWISTMVENPILIERPIVIKGDKAVVARPPESVNELL